MTEHMLKSGKFMVMSALLELSDSEEEARNGRVRNSRLSAQQPGPEEDLGPGLANWMWWQIKEQLVNQVKPTDLQEGQLYEDGKLQPMFFLGLEMIMKGLFHKFKECKEKEKSKILEYRQKQVERVIDYPSSLGFPLSGVHREALLHIMYVKSKKLPHDTDSNDPLTELVKTWQDGASATLKTLTELVGSPYEKICSLDFYQVASEDLTSPAGDRSSIEAVVGLFDEYDCTEDDDCDSESEHSESDHSDSDPDDFGKDHMLLRYELPDFRRVRRSLRTLKSSSHNASKRATQTTDPDSQVMKVLAQFFADYLSCGQRQAYNLYHNLNKGEWI